MRIELSREEFLPMAIRWAREDATSYIVKKFGECKFKIWAKDEFGVEVFIDDELLDCFDGCMGYEDLFYMVKDVLIKNDILENNEISGEELSWFVDEYWCSGGFMVYGLSELSEEGVA